MEARRSLLRAALRQVREELGAEREWVLELGCGHGHFLAAYAARHPSRACLGLDICASRIRKACRKQQRLDLPNLRFVRAEAQEAVALWPTGVSIMQVFVLFPDPWPKRRHEKHRLVSPGLLSRLGRVVDAGGHFHFRSDALPYVEAVRRMLAAHPDWGIAEPPDEFGGISTVFQEKAATFASVSAVRRPRERA